MNTSGWDSENQHTHDGAEVVWSACSFDWVVHGIIDDIEQLSIIQNSILSSVIQRLVGGRSVNSLVGEQ